MIELKVTASSFEDLIQQLNGLKSTHTCGCSVRVVGSVVKEDPPVVKEDPPVVKEDPPVVKKRTTKRKSPAVPSVEESDTTALDAASIKEPEQGEVVELETHTSEVEVVDGLGNATVYRTETFDAKSQLGVKWVNKASYDMTSPYIKYLLLPVEDRNQLHIDERPIAVPTSVYAPFSVSFEDFTRFAAVMHSYEVGIMAFKNARTSFMLRAGCRLSTVIPEEHWYAFITHVMNNALAKNIPDGMHETVMRATLEQQDFPPQLEGVTLHPYGDDIE